TGGTAPYVYLWNDPGAQTNAIATGLCAGTYIVSTTDANGCSDSDTITITAPTLVIAGISGSANVLCNGVCVGTATGSVTGGTAPYTYIWDDPGTQTTLTATGLCAGTFDFAVEDANGCSDTATVIITEPLALVASISGSNDASCNGVCDGDATGTATGGTAPYTYLWDDPLAQTTATATNLCAGSYDFTVTDQNGCIHSVTVVIGQPALLTSAMTDSTNNSCNGSCDGTATVTAAGGTAPYFYNWDAPGGQTDTTATGLCAGIWTVEVTDADGCIDTAAVTITEPLLIVPTMASSDATCGVSNGQASVTASGGVGPYIYLWDDPGTQTNDTATGLASGGYSVDVTDATGCVATGIVTVNDIGAATATISSITNVSCDGGFDGSATVSATGGSPPYTYSWDDPGAQTNATATGLDAGIYVGTVTDSLGCVGSAIAIINEPAPLSLAISSSDVSCFSACDGSATVIASGGTAPYTYLWSPSGCSTPTCATLCAGTHIAMITDSNGCTISDSVIISEPAALSITVSSIAPNCAGACDGSATAIAAGGTAPYNFVWTDSIGDTIGLGASIAGLCAGNYTLTVTDNNGCVNSALFTLADPLGMALTLVSAQATCGASDGTASVSVTNGTGPYTYTWDDPGAQTSDTAVGLAAGTFSVNVVDASGCSIVGSVTVGNAGAPTITTAATNILCNSSCTGTVAATVSGGTAPFTYLWDDPGAQTNSTATGLCAGIFVVTVTDANGCLAFATDTVTEPTALTLIGSSSNPGCNGACDGSATVAVTGGVAPYTYLWDDPTVQITPTASGLCAGTFMIIVVDANGCIDSLSITLADPAVITATTSSIDVGTCGACDGSATVTAGGGTGALTYLWDDAAAQTNATAANLCAGIYTVIVTDANGCSASATDTVNSPGGLLASITGSSNASCNGLCDGTATTMATAGTAPYTYLWNDPGAQTNSAATGLCAGTFTCVVTDASGCTSTATVTLTQPGSVLSATTSISSASCSGICDGMATVVASGGTAPYNYLWNDPAAQTNLTANGLCGGTVSVIVTDANACAVTVSDSIDEGPALTLSFSSTAATDSLSDGTASVVATGTAPYTYLWDDLAAQSTSTATGLLTGSYTCTVIDANGCTDSGSVTVQTFIGIDNVNMALQFEVYPNPTGAIVTLSIQSAKHSNFSIQVENMIGEVLLETIYSGKSSVKEDLNLGSLPNGVYFIRVDSEYGSANRRIVVAR
ncbi:MAG: T9SS type A sorting domain-containing protein, partial [Flavobacteriales bacterium]|nr:T9SS type A sorting domain-containing protein [Flavobacteriales bacterium]